MNEGDKVKCKCGSENFNLIATMQHYGSGWKTQTVCSNCKKPFNIFVFQEESEEK